VSDAAIAETKNKQEKEKKMKIIHAGWMMVAQ